MSRVPRVLSVLAAVATVAGCGATVTTGTLTSVPVAGSAGEQSGAMARSLSSIVSTLGHSRTAPAPAGVGAPEGAAQPGATVPGPQSASTDPAPSASDHPIVALGDSITFGWGMGASTIPYGPAPAHSYPWYLSRDLDVPVVNAGISGTTAHEVLDPDSEPNHPRPPALRLPALLALHPRLLVVSFGSNEAQRGWPTWQTAYDLDRILARVSAAGVPTVLVGTHVDCWTLPCQGPAPGYTKQRYLANWDATLTQLAGRYQSGLVLDVEHGFTREDLTDWIHPTARGYWRMAQRIEPAVVSLLQRQAARPGAEPAPRLPEGGWTPPSGPAAGSNPPPDPRSQDEMWPGGPRDDDAWSLDRVLSWLGVLGVTVPEPNVTPTSRRHMIS